MMPVLNASSSWCLPEAVDVGRHSNCPSDRWHDNIAPLLAAGAAPGSNGLMIMLNVGANKGYNLLEFLQRYTSTSLTHSEWHRLLSTRAAPPCAQQCCGVCIICKRPRMAQAASIAGARLFGFELQPSNVKLLRQMVEMTKAQTEVPIAIHDAAVSNESSLVYTQDSALRPGYESVAAARTQSARHSIARRTVSMDDFLSGSKGCARIDGEANLHLDARGLPCLPPALLKRVTRTRAAQTCGLERGESRRGH